MQLRLDTLPDKLRRIVSVQAVHLSVNQRFQILYGVFDLRCKQIVRHGADGIAHIRDQIRVFNHNLVRLFFPEIGKFPEHFVRCAEIQRVFPVAVRKSLCRQQNPPVDLLLRIEKVDVAGRTDRFMQFFSEPHHRTVKLAQLLFVSGNALCQHKAVVA